MESTSTSSIRVLAAGALLGAALSAGVSVGSSGAVTSLRCAPSGTQGIAGPLGSHVDVFDSLAQLLPARHQAGGAAAYLCQARKAFESFQIEVTAPKSRGVYSVRMHASKLTGPGGASIPASDVRLSREAYTHLTKVTDAELAGVVGRNANGDCTANCYFPDALIPDVDPLFHQKRKAFPFTVPAGHTRAVWVDVQVPKGQRPGSYTGSVTISRSAGHLATVPVHLRVLGATVPATSTIGGAYFIALGGGRVPTPAYYREFAELGLNDRLTIVPDSAYPVSDFATTFAPFVTGNDPRLLLKGARFTAFPMHAGGWSASVVAGYLAKFRSLGAGRLASLYCDEWLPQACANAYQSSAADAPGIPASVVDDPGFRSWPQPDASHPAGAIPTALQGVPIETRIVLGSILQPRNKPSLAPGFRSWRNQAPNRQVWVYESCDAGGCTDAPKDKYTSQFTGWPSYGIDQVASEQRAMGWQLFLDGMRGELYYEVLSATHPATNPLVAGVNGDGTLFYPWDKAEVGGTTPIPLESIRLKRIRDGRQDYELLQRATARSTTDAAKARHIAITLFPAMSRSNVSAATFEAARTQLVALLPH